MNPNLMNGGATPTTGQSLPLDSSSLPFPLPAFLENNPYFSAGFGLAAITVGFGILRKSIGGLEMLAQRSFLTTLEVHNRDPAYPWILRW